MKKSPFKGFLFPAWLCLATCLTACSGHESPPGDNAKTPQTVMLEDIRSVDKLVLSRMTISKMGVVRDRVDLSKAKGWKQMTAGLVDAVKIGSRKAAYSYDTYMRAYIDLSDLPADALEIDEDSATITLTLPEVKTEFEGRDIPIREEHYRVTGFRSRVDAEERADIKEKMNTRLKQEVASNPEFRDQLTRSARLKAESYFKALLARDGYTVVVRFGN